jgi:flagellar capping protein FliD
MSAISSTTGSNVANALLSSNRPTVTGLASGLDSSKIIQQLLAVQQAQIDNLQSQADQVTAQQTAFKGVEARLLTLQSAIAGLARSQGGVFDGSRATSSNSNLVTATAGTGAAPGVYTVRVNSLATASEVASQGFDSATAAITQGTFVIRSGTSSATITINGSNNTLQGLAAAINAAGIGVTAGVVDDGSGSGNQPFRLVLAGNKSGAANAITVTNNLAADGGGATKPVLDSAYVGTADNAPGFTGTAVASANTGAGGYTGATNNTYRFTVVNGGTVGTDDNLQLSYTDSTGAQTGTITLNSGDAGVFKDVAQGLQVKLAAGTLVAGQSFTVKAYVPTLQQASDATVTLGSGSGALSVSSASNQLDSLIPGVTLSLQAADPNTPVTVTVANDTAKAADAVQAFVTDFNDLMSFIDDQVSFDAQTGKGGVLLGNYQVTQIQDQLRSVANGQVAGLNPSMNWLGDLGITLDEQGKLTVDQTRLKNVLSGQVSGVTLDDVRNLFDLSGKSSNPGVQFLLGSVKTKASAAPYQVSITRAATQAALTATNSLASSVTLDNTNNTFAIGLDGIHSAMFNLAAGTYTQQALAQELQNEINNRPELAGRQVTVGVNGGKLVFDSKTYGTASKVSIDGGTALAALGLTGSENATGQDVAGSFVVNGHTETATGTGQFLIGDSTNTNTADIQLRVTLTPDQVGAGTQADLTLTRGIAALTDVALNNMVNPDNGRLKTIDDGFQAIEDNLTKAISDKKAVMQAQQDTLTAKFVAMEEAISQLQSIGSYLSLQFNQLNQQQTQTKTA